MEIREEVIGSELRAELRPLLERGYRVARYHYNPAHFGNVILDLESDVIRIQLVRDRNVWLAEIARLDAPRHDYFDSDIVLSSLGIEPAEGPPRSLAVLVARLDAAAGQWESLFASSQYERACEEFRTIERNQARTNYGYDPDHPG